VGWGCFVDLISWQVVSGGRISKPSPLNRYFISGSRIFINTNTPANFSQPYPLLKQAGRAPKTARTAGGTRAGAGSNILQFYTDDSPGLQVTPTTVLVASLSFVGLVVLLHIWGKFRGA
jgi:preprotein translocase subunit Sec61beta